MIFGSVEELVRVLIVGVPAYAALVFLLRISGKRTLTKLNAFDLVITVALGSTLATILLSSSISLAEGIVALGLLVALQFLVTRVSVHSPTLRHLIKAEPTLLFFRGNYLWSAMLDERVPKTEILQAMRHDGAASPDEVDAVVLETDGSLSVIKSAESDRLPTLSNVSNYPEAAD